MQVSHRHKIILIENPCCANLSVSALLRAERVEGIAASSTPRKVRKELPEGMWEAYEKLIVVRDVRTRFISGVAWVRTASELPSWLLPVQNQPDLASSVLLAVELIESREDGQTLPLVFRPQTVWLSSKLDTIVALNDLPVFANKRQFGTSLCRVNVRVPKPLRLSVGLAERIDAIYSSDVAKFATLPLWSPSPGIVRMLAGNCAECTAKKAAQL